jgi:hypothetical protein
VLDPSDNGSSPHQVVLGHHLGGPKVENVVRFITTRHVRKRNAKG